MIKRNSGRLVDLEYVIPKEHKEEAIVREVEEVQEMWISEPEHEYCSCCGRDSDTIHLLSVFFQREKKWVCLRCLKRALTPEETRPSQASPMPVSASTPAEDSYELSEEPIVASGSNPMSMFD